MRVALYTRVSSEKQDVDLSISAQIKALREYASKHGHTVVKEFVDEAESGRTVARPAFRHMISLARLKDPPFEAILVWKLSRFARSREDSIIYKSLLRKQGIQLISINEPIEDSPMGRLLEGIIEVIDEFYSANLAEDVVRGMRENATRGYFNGSRPPYGYARTSVKDGEKMRTTLEPVSTVMPVVRRIFTECAEGVGLKEIAKGLNRDGIAAPAGGRWGKQSLHKILTNEVYAGCLVWGGRTCDESRLQPIRKEGAWSAIVEKELFDRAQLNLSDRAPRVTHPRVTASHYLLSGLIYCGKCGAAYIGYGAKSGRYHYYVCGTGYSKGREACPSQHLPRDPLESFVVDRIKGYVLTEANLTKLVHLVNEEMDGALREHRERLKAIDAEIDHWQSRLERLYDFVETRAVEPARMAERITTVQDKIEALRKARMEIEEVMRSRRIEPIDPKMVLHYVEDLKGSLEESTVFERRSFLRSFVESIVVNDGTITLNYTLPLPPDDTKHESLSVLGIVNNGRP